METAQSAVSVRAPMAAARAKRASNSFRSWSTCQHATGLNVMPGWEGCLSQLLSASHSLSGPKLQSAVRTKGPSYAPWLPGGALLAKPRSAAKSPWNVQSGSSSSHWPAAHAPAQGVAQLSMAHQLDHIDWPCCGPPLVGQLSIGL